MEEFVSKMDLSKLESTLILVLSFMVLKGLMGLFVTSSQKLGREKKRKLVVNYNSFLLIFVFIGLVSVWSNELRDLALSFVAIGVAIVLATKELILCFTGGIYRAVSGMFDLGDRIEVNGIRGDVISRGLFSTTVVEIGPGQRTHQYTGRSIVIPNSIFLSENVLNESFTKNYVLHSFSIYLPVSADWKKAKRVILEQAEMASSSYSDQAHKYIDKRQRKAHLETPSLKPRVYIRFNGKEELELVVRVTTPATIRGKIEQLIITGFLENFDDWKEVSTKLKS